MNPYNVSRKGLSMVCFVAAILYAFVVGINLPVIVRIADGGIYGGIFFSTGLLFWNIIRFAIPVNKTIIFIAADTVITSFLITGLETFIFFLCFPSSFTAFIATLPTRFFITFLLSIILYLLFLHYFTATEGKRSLPEIVSEEKTSTPSQTSADHNIDRITIRSGTKIKIIPIEKIIYIQADGDYISIHTAEGKWLKEQTMNYTENSLPDDHFVRIHRSFIVNIHFISRIERYGEKQQIVLLNNEKIKISAARYQLLKQILGV